MIFALLLAATIRGAEVQRTISERQSLSLPGEIAPAVVPYLQCMLTDRGGRLAGSRTGDAVRAGIEQLKTDCRTARDQAETRAREMLKASKAPEADREQMIKASLDSIDHSQDHIAERLDRAISGQTETAN